MAAPDANISAALFRQKTMTFEPVFLVPASPGELWIDWAEVMYTESVTLIRCVPKRDFLLPEDAKVLQLRFSRVAAMRISEDPYSLESLDLKNGAPRENNGHLTSPFLRSSRTTWTNEVGIFFGPKPLYHFIIFHGLDAAIGILTPESEPEIALEHSKMLPEAVPDKFQLLRSACVKDALEFALEGKQRKQE